MAIFNSYVSLPELQRLSTICFESSRMKLHVSTGGTQKSTSVFAMKTESLLRHAEKRARTMSSGLPAAPPFRILGVLRPLQCLPVQRFQWCLSMFIISESWKTPLYIHRCRELILFLNTDIFTLIALQKPLCHHSRSLQIKNDRRQHLDPCPFQKHIIVKRTIWTQWNLKIVAFYLSKFKLL